MNQEREDEVESVKDVVYETRYPMNLDDGWKII